MSATPSPRWRGWRRRIVLLSEGKVAAVGPTAEIMQRLDLFPLTGRAEAGAIIEATVERHDERFGLTVLRSPRGPVEAAAPGWRRSGRALRLRVRARDVMLRPSRADRAQRAQRVARRRRRYRGRRWPDRRRPARLQRRDADRAADALLGRAAGPAPRAAGVRPGQERRPRPPQPQRPAAHRRRRRRTSSTLDRDYAAPLAACASLLSSGACSRRSLMP